MGCPARLLAVPLRFSLQQPKADSFLVGVHGQFHTASGISGDVLVIPARSPGKVCVHQRCTSCGYFLFEAKVREVKLVAWYIFVCGNGQTPFLAVGFSWLNLQSYTSLLCIYPACRAPYSDFILQVFLKPVKRDGLLEVQRLGYNPFLYRVVL